MVIYNGILVIKRNEIVPFTETWMDLEHVIQSEVSQKKKNKYRILMHICRRRKWQPIPVLLPGKFHGWRSLVGYSPWGRKELDMTEQLHWFTGSALRVNEDKSV